MHDMTSHQLTNDVTQLCCLFIIDSLDILSVTNLQVPADTLAHMVINNITFSL